MRGMQRASESASVAARHIATPKSQGPELESRSSVADIVDISKAAKGMQASAVVFSVAADMSDIAMSIGARLDQYA
ncbi:hypothetical protein KDL29_05820 [bacterium]|nr:hypothetical protein [bacterium]MCB1221452.1 hypothetical protein [bacterium]UNM09360.1 MAG: hypothetical protein H7A35_04720 [Planctomycetales bacterium]